MSIEKHQSLDILGPLKFLLTCSEIDLDNFELSTLGNLANLKSQAADVMENMLRETSRLDLVRSIRASSPEQIKEALERPSDPIAAAKLKGPALLIAVDPNDDRLELAKLCGAHLGINVKKENAVGRVLELTEGYGCDCLHRRERQTGSGRARLADDPKARNVR